MAHRAWRERALTSILVKPTSGLAERTMEKNVAVILSLRMMYVFLLMYTDERWVFLGELF